MKPLLLVALFALAPQDELQQVDNVLFKVPKGWKLTTEGDDVALMPKDVTKDCVTMILLLKGEHTAKTAREWSDAWWAQLKKELKVQKATERDVVEGTLDKILTSPTIVTRAAGFELENGSGLLASGIVCKVSDRAEAFLYLSTDHEKADAHAEGLKEFLAGLDFTTCRAQQGPSKAVWREDSLSPSFLGKKIPEPKGGAPLHGVWWTADKGSGFNPVSGKYEIASLGDHYVVFLRDGGYYERRPIEGLVNFDLAPWRKRHPLLAGSYQLNGDQGMVTCRNADDTKDAEYPLKRENDKVWIAGKGPYFKMEACDGFELAGTWKRFDHAEERAPQGWATFRKDGTFDEEGLLYAAQIEWQFEREGRANVMAEVVAGKGTWTIGNYTLELVYEDGRKRRAFVCRPPKAEAGSLTIGRFSFVKVK